MGLVEELRDRLAPDRVKTRTIDRIAFANDASVYRLVPRVVVFPTSVGEVRALLDATRRHQVPLTFRAAGTSLSGQSITDGVLAVLSRHWRGLSIEDEGRFVRVQPGVVAGAVNARLRPYGRKIGPDPASIESCMMGGVLANNSSGMCCGVSRNAYHTLRSIRFVLPDGTELDSADPQASRHLARAAPAVAAGLSEWKRRIEADAGLVRKIRSKYSMKNTMGYALNAFLDYSDPLEILAHLMIGSEGTLGFIAEAVLETVPDPPCKYTGLLFFADVPSACRAIVGLRDSGAEALELMDRASLRAVEHQPGLPAAIAGLGPRAAALLVEYACADESERTRREEACERLVRELELTASPSFTRDASERALLWRVRKGLIPSVGAMRRRGTSFIIEDVVFPRDHLAEGVAELQGLFRRHDYDDAIVFGHAKDGNLHFVLTQAFDQPREVTRYDRFMSDLAQLVAVRYGGALKAEHGTGRNMAPFLATEWGEEAVAVMREIKRLIDPSGLLNPGVILNDDPQAHVRDLKDLPPVEQEIDGCIECGFCERSCPSRDLSLTPRQRIVVRREMARLRSEDPASPELRELTASFRWSGLETCAADGLCGIACPVRIDTGRLVRRLRADAHSETAQELARIAAGKLRLVESVTRGLLRLRPGFPDAAGPLPSSTRSGASAVYLPSCVTRVVGHEPGAGGSVAELLMRVSRRAGAVPWIPPIDGHCCGLAFASKGFDEAARDTLERTIDALWRWSDRGRLPVVVDTSPCAAMLRRPEVPLGSNPRARLERLVVLDGIEYAHDHLLRLLEPTPLAGPVALHTVCSVRRLGLEEKLVRIAERCSERAVTPLDAGCCGFAGERGFTHPELTAAATRDQAAELAGQRFLGHYSSSRTCEIGMTRATGRVYRSFWALLERTTRRSPRC